MKQAKILFLCLAVFVMPFVSGCFHANETEDINSSPELVSDPTATQNQPDPSSEIPSVEKLTLSGNEIDGSYISADYATEELLTQYQSYEEFVESEDTECGVNILFKISETVKDVRFLIIYFEDSGDDDSLSWNVNKTLYSKDTITPEKPLVVGTVFEGDFPTRAISFVDGDNVTRYYAVTMSGKDGSVVLLEMVPVKDN